MQQMHNPQLLTPFMAWKGLFQHLEWLTIMKFRNTHEIQIGEW